MFWGAMDMVKEGQARKKRIIVRPSRFRSGLFELYTYHFPKHWSAACVANRELIKEAQRQAHALEHAHTREALEWRTRFLSHYFRVFTKAVPSPNPASNPTPVSTNIPTWLSTANSRQNSKPNSKPPRKKPLSPTPISNISPTLLSNPSPRKSPLSPSLPVPILSVHTGSAPYVYPSAPRCPVLASSASERFICSRYDLMIL